MSSPNHAIVPSAFKSGLLATFIAADGVAAKLVVDTTAAQAPSSTLPRLIGGCTIIDFTAASTDGSDREFIVWNGTVVTTVGGTTGTAAVATSSTITRATGSFITDGWVPGDLVMMFGVTTVGSAQARVAGVDGVLGTITGVSATTLTVNGTPFTVNALATGVRICKMSYGARVKVSANAGTNGSSATQQMIGQGNDATLLKYEKKLGKDDIVAVAPVGGAVSALPAYISFSTELALY